MLAPTPQSEETTFDAPTVYAVAENRELLIEALNERRIELRMSMAEFDDIAELSTGAAAKFLGPSVVKNLGVHTPFKMLNGLALRLVLEIDPERTAEVVELRRPMNPNQARPNNLAQICGPRAVERVCRHLEANGGRNGKRRAAALKKWALELDWNEVKRAARETREVRERRSSARHSGLTARWHSRKKEDT